MKKKKKKPVIIWLAVAVVLLIAAFFLLKDIVLKNIYPLEFKEEIIKYANEYELDPYLVASVIWAESGYRKEAVSNKGATGLMQIMPDTGKWIAGKLKIKGYSEEQLLIPDLNIRMGCWYLKYLNGKFSGDLKKILAGYNAGPGKVQSWLENKKHSPDGETLKSIPYAETKNYVDKIVRAYDIYKSLYKFS